MKAWCTLFAQAQDFNYNDVTFIYDKMHDVGVSKVSMDGYMHCCIATYETSAA